MKDYAVTYQVTVFISANDKTKAELTADTLVNSADNGWADATICIDKMVGTKQVKGYI